MSVHPLASAARRFDIAKPSSFTRASRSLSRGPLVLVGVALAALILITWRLRPHPYTSGGPWSTSPMAPLVTTVASTSVHPEQQQRRSVVPPLFRPLVKGKDYFSDYDIGSALQHFTPAEATAPNVRPPLFRYVEPALVSEYAVHYVSNEPRVAVVQDFLTAAECDALIHEASKSMFRSQVAPTQGSKDAPVQDVRTSSQAWLHAASDPARPIVQRILALTGFPPGSNEELQILRYEVSQKYDAHNDYFDPKMYGPQQTNRALTFYLYLSDVEEGGETWFPRADGKPPTFDFTSCSRGLGVRPKRGMAVIFYDMKPNGELDPYSLHGACPVKKGVKWGGTLWLRMPTP